MSDQLLSAKDQAQFKQVLKLYEHKQYKKGNKLVDTLIKKYPNHGESLAMKGLFISHLDNKEEAYDYVKKGLRFDLKSSICWHVYGLLYRGDKNYEEALKCYRHAIKYDKENIQVLRDFAFLQIQMRDYIGFKETKTILLELRPNQRVYWIGLAIAYHMLGKFTTAIEILDTYEKTAKERDESVAFEHSELMMYKNLIIEESGNYELQLAHLLEIKDVVSDRLAWNEKRVNVLMKLGRYGESINLFKQLINDNSENFPSYVGLLKAHQINISDPNEDEMIRICEIFEEIGDLHPKSNCIRRLPLTYLKGDLFLRKLHTYLIPLFRKGVPSLFVSIKSLLSNEYKNKVIIQTVESYKSNLVQHGVFKLPDHPIDSEDKESPTCYLWVLYFLAQYYDFSGNYERALSLLQEAEQHTPTLIELMMLKARIYKHCGNMTIASRLMDEARKLDLQDRYMNTKSTKYHYRNDDQSKAESTIALFARQGTFEEKMNDLIEMQCLWLALESGNSYLRLQNYSRALKRFHQISKIYVDILDDQFDFHTYSLRKMTIRSYIDLLRFEDNVFGKGALVTNGIDYGIRGSDENDKKGMYVRAMEGAVGVYLDLFDGKLKQKDENDMNGLSKEEAKKLKSKLRRAKLREQEEIEAKKLLDAKVENKTEGKKIVKDLDPNGDKLISTTQPLVDALNFLAPLQKVCTDLLTVHLHAFEIYIRQQKFLLAYKALFHSRQIAHASPTKLKNAPVHWIFIRFWNTLLNLSAEEKNGISSITLEIINECEWKINSLTELTNLNDQILQKASQPNELDFGLLLVACKCKSVLNPKDDSIIPLLLNIVTAQSQSNSSALKINDVSLLLNTLSFLNCPVSKINEFKLILSKMFPWCTLVIDSQEQEKLELEVFKGISDPDDEKEAIGQVEIGKIQQGLENVCIESNGEWEYYV